jgi:hypothetical protein
MNGRLSEAGAVVAAVQIPCPRATVLPATIGDGPAEVNLCARKKAGNLLIWLMNFADG